MKKAYIFLFLVFSFLGISSVNAETYNINVLHSDNWYDNFDNTISDYSAHTEIYNNMISLWNTNYSSSYPYYAIRWRVFSGYRIVDLIMSDNSSTTISLGNNGIKPQSSSTLVIRYSDNISNPINYEVVSNVDTSITYFYDCTNFSCSTSDNYLLYNSGFVMKNYQWSVEPTGSHNTYNYYIEKVIFPVFNSLSYDYTTSSIEIELNDLIPSYLSLYNEEYNPDIFNNYTEINLNSYEYVLLTLKDYSNTNEYWTRIYTLGKLCLTPVYDYGMREKKTYYSGYQVDGCTEYYDEYTPVRVYILTQDIENHVVYYLKSSNTSISNSVKVDNNIFDITYITSANSSNPSVVIDGRSYPTIPYNDLTDTAIISDETGYISGQVCPLGDANCYYNTMGVDITDLFTHPLQLLTSVWGSITNMFVLIGAFIMLLPPILQAFLFSSFMLAILLGIIKIII